MSETIDKSSPVPLYLQLERALREKIAVKLGGAGEPLGTIDEISRAYGVSAITVKHSLYRLAEQGIVKSIKSKGYFILKVPPRENSTKEVALSVFVGERTLMNPMYVRLCEGAADILEKNKFTLNIYSPEELMSNDFSRNPDFYGFIIVGLRSHEFHDSLFVSGSRFVLADISSGIYPSVLTDNRLGARMAVEYLLKLGHKEIAIIKGNPDSENFSARYEGYADAMKENNIPIKKDFVVEYFKIPVDKRSAVMRNLLAKKERPTAIFFTADLPALYHIPDITAAGFRIPEDVSIIGFDDLEASFYAEPSLTTVKQPMYKVGMAAAKMLLDMKDRRDVPHSPAPVLIAPELIERNSCAPPPLL